MLEVLAAFVHGGVAFGNALGLLYNVMKKNRRWALIHAAGIVLHVKATMDHVKDIRNGVDA